jgi:hypothetical protein
VLPPTFQAVRAGDGQVSVLLGALEWPPSGIVPVASSGLEVWTRFFVLDVGQGQEMLPLVAAHASAAEEPQSDRDEDYDEDDHTSPSCGRCV